jgi:hypothetical protein
MQVIFMKFPSTTGYFLLCIFLVCKRKRLTKGKAWITQKENNHYLHSQWLPQIELVSSVPLQLTSSKSVSGIVLRYVCGGPHADARLAVGGKTVLNRVIILHDSGRDSATDKSEKKSGGRSAESAYTFVNQLLLILSLTVRVHRSHSNAEISKLAGISKTRKRYEYHTWNSLRTPTPTERDSGLAI